MPNGTFFSPSQLKMTREPPLLVPRCGKCGLFLKCNSPKMKVAGGGNLGVLIVGESPGRDEDEQGRPFVGESGRLLRRSLRKIGVDADRDCWITNAVICHPEGNKLPSDRVIDYCRPNLTNTIRDLDPKVIILLGGKAVRSMLATAFKEDVGGIKRWAGFRIPCRSPNAWVCPTFHPAFILREERVREVIQHFFDRHIAGAIEKSTSRPWKEVPDYGGAVLKVKDHREAARIVRGFAASGLLVAFDYETNMLKPDSDKARIVSCSVSDGNMSVAYPWYGEAIEATKEMLQSPSVGKIASNAKFEERWTRAKLGCRVANWRWDTMVQAHVLDNRPGITGLKFQAFVRLGQEDYDGHLKAMLGTKEKRGNEENRVRDIDLNDLLTYNALDSLLEYKVAIQQAKELGVKL